MTSQEKASQDNKAELPKDHSATQQAIGKHSTTQTIIDLADVPFNGPHTD